LRTDDPPERSEQLLPVMLVGSCPASLLLELQRCERIAPSATRSPTSSSRPVPPVWWQLGRSRAASGPHRRLRPGHPRTRGAGGRSAHGWSSSASDQGRRSVTPS